MTTIISIKKIIIFAIVTLLITFAAFGIQDCDGDWLKRVDICNQK